MSVYFLRPIGMEGPIKIGFSDQPERRLKEMMMWSPIPLEIVATVEGGKWLEGCLHEAFVDARTHWEWFRPIPDLLMAIRRLSEGHLPATAFDLFRHKRLTRSAERNRHLPPWPPEDAPAYLRRVG